MTPEIQQKAPLILEEIKKASSILLHCHPSPDPDSVGSALAMKFVLEQLGKKVTIIKGDSDIPEAFMHFPGATEIVKKNFFEIDLKEFDLFIIQDSGKQEMISRIGEIVFPPTLNTVVIDHHRSNPGYARLNLLETTYPATAQILFDVFKIWGIILTSEIAINIFMGTYTDTGGFSFPGTSVHTFEMATELVKVAPNFSQVIDEMQNSNTPGSLAFQGLALTHIETFFDGKVALSVVPFELLEKHGITPNDSKAGDISPILRTVKAWNIGASLIEATPGKIKTSFRAQDGEKFDVGKLAMAIGGGGHKAAAGAVLEMPIEQAKELVVSKIKELYNL
jgi:bifunctional oligoribonuclease and PAP phosphatase NrnA